MSHDHDLTLDATTLRSLRAALPAAAFQPDPGKLPAILALAAVVVAAHAAVAAVGLSLWLLPLALIAAITLSSLAFATHELAHGLVLRPGRLQRVGELLFWSLLLISPTMWRRVHNQAHHAHANTPGDPDRPLHADEAGPGTRWYVWIFYPNAEVFPWNPMVFLHFVSYITRNTVAALLPARLKPTIVTRRPDYSRSDSLRIAAELVVIVAVQTGLFFISGARLGPFLLMALGVQGFTSCISMSYIFTNHFLNPLSHEADPVRGTTSVIVPAWVDRFHWNFSYHTEHHVFPTMNSDYYPALSRELARRFPGEYQRIPIGEAWRRLWQRRGFATPPLSAGKVSL